MILWIFVVGLIVGLTSGVPFGPVGAVCIRKSLSNEEKGGYIFGIGAALADGIFALVASFGIVAISRFLSSNESIINIVGGIFLIGVGIKELKSRNLVKHNDPSTKKDLLSGFTVALASPFVIFSFFALYALLGVGGVSENYLHSFFLAASTLVGSVIGITLLNWIVIKNKSNILPKTISKINNVLGLIIFGTGGYLLFRGLFF